MAIVQTLGPSGDTVNLADQTKHAIVLNGLTFKPRRGRVWLPISGRDAARLAYSQGELQEITAMVSLTGADHNTIITNHRNVEDKLRKAREYALDGIGTVCEFTWQFENATSPTVWEVLDGDIPPVPEFTHPWANQRIDLPLTLLCQPYARSASVLTATSSTLTNDTTGYTVSPAVVGDAMARLRLAIQNKQASTTMGFIRAAVRSRGDPANFIFPITPAVAQTGITVTLLLGAVDAGDHLTLNGSGANVDYVRVTLTSNLRDWYGAYRVHLRMLGTAGEQVILRWAGPTGTKRSNARVALGATGAYHVVDVGMMNIPEQELPGDLTPTSYSFTIGRGDGANNLQLQAIELWPADQYVEWENTTGPAENEFAVIDGLSRQPSAFLADSSGNPINSLFHAGIAPELRPGGTNRILARASRSRLDDRTTDSLAISAKYYPSWAYQRGSA